MQLGDGPDDRTISQGRSRGQEFRLDEHDDGPEARVDRTVILEQLRLDDWEEVLYGEVRAHLRAGWWVSGFGVWLFRV